MDLDCWEDEDDEDMKMGCDTRDGAAALVGPRGGDVDRVTTGTLC